MKVTTILGSPKKNNADLIQAIFDRINNFGQCNVIGKYVVPFCSTPDSIGDEAMEIVKKMTGDIIAVQG